MCEIKNESCKNSRESWGNHVINPPFSDLNILIFKVKAGSF